MNPETAGQLEKKAQEALLSFHELVEPPETSSHKSSKRSKVIVTKEEYFANLASSGDDIAVDMG